MTSRSYAKAYKYLKQYGCFKSSEGFWCDNSGLPIGKTAPIAAKTHKKWQDPNKFFSDIAKASSTKVSATPVSKSVIKKTKPPKPVKKPTKTIKEIEKEIKKLQKEVEELQLTDEEEDEDDDLWDLNDIEDEDEDEDEEPEQRNIIDSQKMKPIYKSPNGPGPQKMKPIKKFRKRKAKDDGLFGWEDYENNG